jgi:uncharacterized protein (TIGR03000 family)
MLAFAGAAVLMTAGPVHAQRGGHGGGGHSGGFGGGHGGGGFGGFGGFHGSGHSGGFHGSGIGIGGYYHGGYGRGYGYRPYFGHHHYYGGYYPYSSSYPYYNDAYFSGGGESLEDAHANGSPLLGDHVTYDSGYQGLSAQEYQAYAQAGAGNYARAATPVDTTAHVTVRVPADAVIWFDETRMTSTGSAREYQSPPLTPGNRYTYEIRARWNENGQPVSQTQQVVVTAGGHFNVTFPDESSAAQ